MDMDMGKKLVAATYLSLLVAPTALADLSYVQRITVEGAGGMSMFASEGTVLTQLSGDKSRTDNEIKMKSRLVSMFGGDGKTTNIVRLDKGLTWNLLPENKQYSEVTFEQMRAQMKKAQDAMKNAGGENSQALPVTADSCQWTEGDIEVEHPKDRQKVANIKTKKHIVRLRQSCTDPDTGKTCDITWVMETWLAKKVPAEREVRAYQKAYAEALGLDDLMQQVQGPGQGLLAMFADNWDEVVDEFDKMKGYPLRTTMQMGMGGEQCTTASGEPIAMDDVWADASMAAYNAGLDQAGYEAGRAVGDSVGSALGGSVGGRIGGSVVGAAAGELIGGLSGMFKKKKPEPEAVPEPQPEVSPGGKQVTVFRIETEVIKWSEVSVPAERFDEPVGWTKN